MVLLFIFDLLRYVFYIDFPLPQLFTPKFATLLVSVKIIWMIHKDDEVEHLQFWVLNSIKLMISFYDLGRQYENGT